MRFTPPLIKATLLKRYKRFLADVELSSGEVITIHCPNTGSMKNCLVEGSDCWISLSDNPKRKYAHTWEIASAPNRKKAGINTGLANHLVVEAVENGTIQELQGYEKLQTEVAYGEERSRIDILLSSKDSMQKCYVEIKNVTYAMTSGVGLFPDAVSVRGQKHLRELIGQTKNGHRSVLFFCVQHTGIDQVKPAEEIDPDYANLLREAVLCGVEVIAYRARISAKEICLVEKVQFSL